MSFTRKKINELMKEPDYDYIEKINKISSDGRNLVTRIPKEIANYFNIKVGDKIRFYVKIEHNKKGKLEISIIKDRKKK